MPKNAKKTVYKEKEFEMYTLWKSMPAYFRGMKKEQLHSHGFTDPLVMKIATIQSQTEFAKKFRIKDLGTLTDWNNKIKNNKLDTKKSHLTFQKQVENVNNVIPTNSIKLLEKRLYKQRASLYKLKKENALLKKQISKKITVKPIKAIPPPILEPIPVQIQITQPSEDEGKINFFKKALSFFKKIDL